MKKGVFNIWLKELCSLVFVQSIQAFLLAIVMSIIVSAASSENALADSASVSAVGVISIVALASISKIELLVKKIFGIESQFGDPSMANGMKSVAGGIIAAKAVGKTLNNVPSMLSGAREISGARKDKARANYNLARRLRALGIENETAQGGASDAAAPANENQTTVNANTTVGVNGGATTTSSTQTTSTTTSSNTTATNNTTASNRANSNKYSQQILNIQERYEEELGKANKRRSEGKHRIATGVTESVGAITGAAAGLAVGAGTGDVSRGVAMGVGTGDMIGKTMVSAVKTLNNASSDRKSIRNQEMKTLNEMKKLIDSDAVSETRNARSFRERRALRQEAKEVAEKIEREYGVKIDAGKL